MFFPREHYLIFFSQATKAYSTPSTQARPSQVLVCCSAKHPAEALDSPDKHPNPTQCKANVRHFQMDIQKLAEWEAI